MIPEILVIAAFVMALIISLISTPSIVLVALQKGMCEKPDDRRLHKGVVPTLGGVAVFAASMLPIFIFKCPQAYAFATGCLILFFIGIKDDILLIAPITKLVGQIVAALLVTVCFDVRITDLHGFFSIFEINYFVSVPLTVLIYITVINAYNLIDGVDGLCGLLSLVASVFFGAWFIKIHQYDLGIICAAFAGAIVGFLRYNLYSKKMKIFLGDTGSQLVGFFCAFAAIYFNELNINIFDEYKILPSPSVSIAVICIPLFDMFRVMFIRFMTKRGIFSPDNNHIHFKLMKLGMTHKQISFTLFAIQSIIAIFAFLVSDFVPVRTLLLSLILLLMIIYYIPEYLLNRKIKNEN